MRMRGDEAEQWTSLSELMRLPWEFLVRSSCTPPTAVSHGTWDSLWYMRHDRVTFPQNETFPNPYIFSFETSFSAVALHEITLLVFKENTETSKYNDFGYWARNHLPNGNHLSHSPDVPRASLPYYIKFAGAEKTSCHFSDRNGTAEALRETHFQSNSKAWSSVTFLALGGTNDTSLIIACFGVTSLSIKLKNKVCCVVSIGLIIRLRKSSVVGDWNRPPLWVVTPSVGFCLT